MADASLIACRTIEELEQEFTRPAEQLANESPKRAAALAKPFGFQNEEWEAFKTHLQPGDELWTFATSRESWAHLAGRAGVARVRDGEIIETLVTLMN